MSSAKPKAAEVAPKYKDLVKSVEASGRLLLQMARHPDCELERLLPHIHQYRENYKFLSDLTEKLRKAFPQRTYGETRGLPWWEQR